jgi:hypothetical protein
MHLYTLLRNNSRKDIKHDVCYLEINEHGLSLSAEDRSGPRKDSHRPADAPF